MDFAAFRDFGLLEMFTALGWTFFMNLKEYVYPALVREFYKNLPYDYIGGYARRVKGNNHLLLCSMLR